MKRLSLVLSLLVVLAAARAQRLEFTAPSDTSQDTVRYDEFIGAQACADCHQPQYNAWRTSTHGQAGGPPSDVNVLASFDGTPIQFRDATVIPDIAPDGTYRFTVRRDGRPEQVFAVDGVVGGGHMVGGGTQGFVSRFPDGTTRFLPFDYSRGATTWFCNTSRLTAWWTPTGTVSELRPDTGWVPITPDMPLTDCGDWPPVRTLGTTTDFANCQQCHGSQVTLRFDAETRRYDTRIASLAIDCESCHGPAERHVQLARNSQLDSTLGLPSLSTLDVDASLDVCFQCHALKRTLAPGYLPGADFDDHYSLRAPVLSDDPFWGDGRARNFAYQQNHLSSACYLSGTMTCTDCHAPHGQEYRDVFGAELDGRFDDGQCLDCHPSKASDPTRHTHHAPDSPGSRCVSCHMPYLQHPSVGNQIPYARSDHTIAIPRPAFDASLGIEGACRSCHGDMSIEGLQHTVGQWYGTLKPHRDLVATLVGSGGPGDLFEAIVTEATAASSGNGERPEVLARVQLIDRLVRSALTPDMPVGDERLVNALRTLGASGNLDVRAIALAAMHLAWGEQSDVRANLTATLEGAGADDRALRRRWSWALRGYANRYRDAGQLDRAVSVYRKALEVLPENPDALSDLAATHAMRGNLSDAERLYRRALDRDSLQPKVLVNLGLVFEQSGRQSEAIAAYESAVRINPRESLAQANLGNIAFAQADYATAIARYQNAVLADPTLVNTQLLLAQSFILANQLDSALVHARTALEFSPQNDTARRMVQDLRGIVP